MRENPLILLCTVWKRRDAASLHLNVRKTKEKQIDFRHNPPAPQNTSSQGEVIEPTSVGLKSNKTNQKSSDCEDFSLPFLLAVKHWFWSSHSDPAVFEAASTLLFPFSWIFIFSLKSTICFFIFTVTVNFLVLPNENALPFVTAAVFGSSERKQKLPREKLLTHPHK